MIVTFLEGDRVEIEVTEDEGSLFLSLAEMVKDSYAIGQIGAAIATEPRILKMSRDEYSTLSTALNDIGAVELARGMVPLPE